MSSGQVIDLQSARELSTEVEAIEAWYGPNAYSTYLRKYGRRPNAREAAGMGRTMGGRVRAEDGTMQPPISAENRAFLKGVKARRTAFADHYEGLLKLQTAIALLAELDIDPTELVGDGSCLANLQIVPSDIERGIYLLSRFAEHLYVITQASGATDPQFPGSDQKQDRA